MRIHNRLVWVSGSLLFAGAIAAEEPPKASERVAAAALEAMAEDTDARLAEMQQSLDANLTAQLERAAATQIASHFDRRRMGPPVPVRPARSLPARRATALAAGAPERPVEPAPVAATSTVEKAPVAAATAVRVRTDQEPFGG